MIYNLPGDKVKKSMYASLFDKFGGGSDDIDNDQKSALFRQGLLGLGAGLLGTPGGFGAGLGAGIQNGLLAMNSGQEQLADQRYKRQRMEAGTDDPAGYRQADLMARAAGYQPGTPEYQRAMKVGLGVEGRASNAGFGFQEVEGGDGRKRLTRQNPRTGAVEIYDEATGKNMPFGGATTSSTPNTSSPSPIPATYNRQYVIDPSLPPAIQQQIREQEAASGNGYVLPSVSAPSQQAPAIQAPPAAAFPSARPALATSRTKEEEIYATEAAKVRAGLDYAPATTAAEVDRTQQVETVKGGIEVGTAMAKEQGIAGLQRQSSLRAELPGLRATQAALLEAYNGFKSGKYSSGAFTGALPTRFQSAANQELITTINDQILATAERMKGTISDKDVAFLKSATFNLDNDEQANMNIIGRKLKIINEAVERAAGRPKPAPKPAMVPKKFQGFEVID